MYPETPLISYLSYIFIIIKYVSQPFQIVHLQSIMEHIGTLNHEGPYHVGRSFTRRKTTLLLRWNLVRRTCL